MNWFHDKVIYTGTVMLSSGILWLGTILTDSEVRWLYATGAAALMTSGFVSLALRKNNDSIRVIISRTGLGFVGGAVGTKVALELLPSLASIKKASDHDILLLAGLAAIMSTLCCIVGYSLIRVADDSAQTISQRILARALVFLGVHLPQPQTQKEKTDDKV